MVKITFDSLFVDSDNYGVVIFHVVLFFAFALLRIPLLMDVKKHFESGTNKKIDDYVGMSMKDIVFNAFYQSVLVQSAWGALDLMPISRTAKLLNLIQTLISFFITAGTVNLIYRKTTRQMRR